MIDAKLVQAAYESLKNPGGGASLPKVKKKTGRPILYIFRHAQSYDNIRRIFSGRRNSRLTPAGLKQAQELAEKLRGEKIDLFITPPLKRCRQTLDVVKKYHPQADMLVSKDLLERDYGDLTGKSKLKMMKLYPKKAVLWRRSWDVPPPNGESLKMVWQNRIKPFLKNWLIPKMKQEKINVGWSATNNTMRLVRMYFEGLSIKDMLKLENPYGDWAEYEIS
ncbi:MAG: histidine phosphatase family protein [bacterium]|nr:histidine phosphatase family protein [bacterium]